jgi:hypothetical protein
MTTRSPGSLTPAERRARRNRAVRIARQLGFTGSVEYRHVYSQTGGAQYGQGKEPEEDLLTVYAEAFERDADSVGGARMIGTKKLSTIRKQIEKALGSTGADPIRRLERQIATAKRKGDRTEVLEGLKQFLESPPKRQHRKPGVRAEA